MPLVSFLIAIALFPAPDDPKGWTELAGPNGLKAWKAPTGDWAEVGSVKIDPANEKRLASEAGSGLIVNGKLGRTFNLVSREEFGDVEMHVEFLIPKGSNAGVKLHGQYEIQILDSFGKATPAATDCGGIYPRAELLPTYRYLDKGYPPKVNACKPAGEWQTLDITFRSPRFGADGKKTQDAEFVKVLLNGQVVQEDQKVPCPTGHAWKNKESARGPVLLQADHGPVAFRSVKVRPLDGGDSTR